MGALWTSALFLSVIVMLVAVAQIGMNGRQVTLKPTDRNHPSQAAEFHP